MKIQIRLYRQHDLDLIALHLNPNFSLPYAMKQAILAHVYGKNFGIMQPKPAPLPHQIRKSIPLQLNLTEEHDGVEVMEWLEHIERGYRNSLFKNILRSYLAGACTQYYFDEDERKKEEQRTQKMSENLKETETLNKKRQKNKKLYEEYVEEQHPYTPKQTEITVIEDVKKEDQLKLSDINENLDLKETKENQKEDIIKEQQKQEKIDPKPLQQTQTSSFAQPSTFSSEPSSLEDDNEDDLFDSFEQMMNQF